MELSRRRLSPGEMDHELIWLTVSLGSLAATAVWLRLGLPWPTCVFHEITGLPCLTCGATRSAMEFFHGHFLGAWKWNPLAFTSYCALSIFNVYAAVVLVARLPRLRITSFSAAGKNLARAFVLMVLTVNWIYLLTHARAFA
jgi:hypothetical protein